MAEKLTNGTEESKGSTSTLSMEFKIVRQRSSVNRALFGVIQQRNILHNILVDDMHNYHGAFKVMDPNTYTGKGKIRVTLWREGHGPIVTHWDGKNKLNYWEILDEEKFREAKQRGEEPPEKDKVYLDENAELGKKYLDMGFRTYYYAPRAPSDKDLNYHIIGWTVPYNPSHKKPRKKEKEAYKGRRKRINKLIGAHSMMLQSACREFSVTLKKHMARTQDGLTGYKRYDYRRANGSFTIPTLLGVKTKEHVKVTDTHIKLPLDEKWLQYRLPSEEREKPDNIRQVRLVMKNGKAFIQFIYEVKDKAQVDIQRIIGVDTNHDSIDFFDGNEPRWIPRMEDKLSMRVGMLKAIAEKLSSRIDQFPPSNKMSLSQKRELNRLIDKRRKIRSNMQAIRKECDHIISRKLVNRADLIFVEDLKGQKMILRQKKKQASSDRKHERARSTHAKHTATRGFVGFVPFLEYKTKKEGKGFKKVNPAYTSQHCSSCLEKGESVKVKDIKTQRRIKCPKCGHSEDRDANAARNIYLRGMKECRPSL